MAWYTVGQIMTLFFQWLILMAIPIICDFSDAGIFSVAISMSSIFYTIASCYHLYTFQYSDLTAIEGLTSTDTSDGAWYTLSGQKLDGEPTEKGVYIKDGKKVVIK